MGYFGICESLINYPYVDNSSMMLKIGIIVAAIIIGGAMIYFTVMDAKKPKN